MQAIPIQADVILPDTPNESAVPRKSVDAANIFTQVLQVAQKNILPASASVHLGPGVELGRGRSGEKKVGERASSGPAIPVLAAPVAAEAKPVASEISPSREAPILSLVAIPDAVPVSGSPSAPAASSGSEGTVPNARLDRDNQSAIARAAAHVQRDATTQKPEVVPAQQWQVVAANADKQTPPGSMVTQTNSAIAPITDFVSPTGPMPQPKGNFQQAETKPLTTTMVNLASPGRPIPQPNESWDQQPSARPRSPVDPSASTAPSRESTGPPLSELAHGDVPTGKSLLFAEFAPQVAEVASLIPIAAQRQGPPLQAMERFAAGSANYAARVIPPAAAEKVSRSAIESGRLTSSPLSPPIWGEFNRADVSMPTASRPEIATRALGTRSKPDDHTKGSPEAHAASLSEHPTPKPSDSFPSPQEANANTQPAWNSAQATPDGPVNRRDQPGFVPASANLLAQVSPAAEQASGRTAATSPPVQSELPAT
ncbi:MAG TPA: hypothetical protein VEZ90_19795, partial [Blastocatellia bacterium]|nr:hypothetical protein [Blastocatellia bacterium]